MIVSIEGNIGSGKTTLLSELKSELGEYIGRGKRVVYVKEPVEEWNAIKDKDGNSMLDLLYSDAKKHSFAFQMMAYITRLRALKSAREMYPDAILVTERCLQTDRHVFASMLRDSGDILDIHWKIYEEWAITLNPEVQPDLYVYVRATPTKSLERVVKRARKSESSISLDYLKACHEKHEEWLNSIEKTRTITFEADEEFVGTDKIKKLAQRLMRVIL